MAPDPWEMIEECKLSATYTFQFPFLVNDLLTSVPYPDCVNALMIVGTGTFFQLL
jgi:hypothetical protein